MKDLFLKRNGSFILLLILLFGVTIGCKESKIESSKKQRVERNSSIDSLNNLAWDNVNRDISLFYNLGVEAFESSRQKNYLFGQCESAQILGSYFYYTGVLDSALVWYQLALEKRKEYGDSSMISGTLNNIGALYEKKGSFNIGLDYYLIAEEFIPQRKQAKRARINDNIGVVYTKLGNYSEALKYNQKATLLFDRVFPEKNAHIKNQLNKANILELMSDYNTADSLYRNVADKFLIYGDTLSYVKTINNLGNTHLKQGKINDALQYYLEALSRYEIYGYQAELAGVEQNLGILYKIKGDYKKSITFFKNSIQKWKGLNNLQKVGELLINLGDVYLIQEEYLDTEKAYLEAQSYVSFNLELRSKLYDGLFLVYSKRKMYDKALPYQMKYTSIVDSISFEQIKWRNLESEFIRNKNKVLLLEKEKKTVAERIEKEKLLRYFLISVILFASTLALLLYLNWRGKRKRLLAEKKALEKQREVEGLLKDQELSSIRKILDLQDQERKRIAQDLHDRLGSMLSMVKLHFQKTSKNIEKLERLNQEEYLKANNLLDEACDEVRKIAHNLMSGVLKNFGLIAAMKELKSTLENTDQYKVELLTHQFEERLPSNYETAIYRIIQELVSNIIRHANATEISFQFFMKKKLLQITVEDNGSGFDLDEIKEKGMGLKNIQSRLVFLNGEIEIDSRKGRGTSVIIEIPLNIKS